MSSPDFALPQATKPMKKIAATYESHAHLGSTMKFSERA
jgi:hypothetical protein